MINLKEFFDRAWVHNTIATLIALLLIFISYSGMGSSNRAYSSSCADFNGDQSACTSVLGCNWDVVSCGNFDADAVLCNSQVGCTYNSYSNTCPDYSSNSGGCMSAGCSYPANLGDCSVYSGDPSTCTTISGCSYPGNTGVCSDSNSDENSCRSKGCSFSSYNDSSGNYIGVCSGSYDTGACVGSYDNGVCTGNNGGSNCTGSYSPGTCSGSYDSTVPEISSAAVVGTTLTLTYNEPLNSFYVPSSADFLTYVNGLAGPLVSSVSVVDYTVVLTLDTSVGWGTAVQVAYAGSGMIRDVTGNSAAAFVSQSVTNNTSATIFYHNGTGDLNNSAYWYDDSGMSIPHGSIPSSGTCIIPSGVVVTSVSSIDSNTLGCALVVNGTLNLTNGSSLNLGFSPITINSGGYMDVSNASSLTITNNTINIEEGGQLHISTNGVFNFQNGSTLNVRGVFSDEQSALYIDGNLNIRNSQVILEDIEWIVRSGGVLTVDAYHSLTVNSGASLAIDNDGTLANNGTLTNQGVWTKTAGGIITTGVSASTQNLAATSYSISGVSGSEITPYLISSQTDNGATNYNVTLSHTPDSWTAQSLPSGLSINPDTGEITGTPNSSGSGNFTVISTGANGGSASQSVSYNFSEATPPSGSDTTPPSISITAPSDESTVSTFSPSVSWGDSVVCEYKFDSDSYSSINCAGDGSDIPAPSEGLHILTIRGVDASENMTTASVLFTYSVFAPAPPDNNGGNNISDNAATNTDSRLNTNTSIVSARGGNTMLVYRGAPLAPSAMTTITKALPPPPYINSVSGKDVSKINELIQGKFSDTTFTQSFTPSDKNNEVKKLQQLLNTLGFTIAKTGAGSPGNETTNFGGLTKEALKEFQRSVGINPPTGNFGPLTRRYVNNLIKNISNNKNFPGNR